MSAITDGRALRAKRPGTGMLDTPAEAWAALFRDFMAGSGPLCDVFPRHGIRHSAAYERAGREHWANYRAALEAARWLEGPAVSVFPASPKNRERHARTIADMRYRIVHWRRCAAQLRHYGAPPYMLEAVGQTPPPVCKTCGGAIAEDRVHYWDLCDACTPRSTRAPGAKPHRDRHPPTVDVRAPVVDLAAYRARRSVEVQP